MPKGDELGAAERASRSSFVKIDRSGGPDACWEWTGQRLPKGYGQIFVRAGGGRSWLAHRLAWIHANGTPIPEDLQVLHSCDNPPCCNPAHLSVGTQAQNNRDMYGRGGRDHGGWRKSLCAHGHIKTPETSRIRPGRPGSNGVLVCLICERERDRARRRRGSADGTTSTLPGRTSC